MLTGVQKINGRAYTFDPPGGGVGGGGGGGGPSLQPMCWEYAPEASFERKLTQQRSHQSSPRHHVRV